MRASLVGFLMMIGASCIGGLAHGQIWETGGIGYVPPGSTELTGPNVDIGRVTAPPEPVPLIPSQVRGTLPPYEPRPPQNDIHQFDISVQRAPEFTRLDTEIRELPGSAPARP